MTFTRVILLLAAASPPVPLHVGDTLAIITGETPSAKTLALASAGLAQMQQSPENLIHVEIGGLRNDKGQVLCAIYSSADGFPKKGDKAVAHANPRSPLGMQSASFLASMQALMLFQYSTTRILTANWTQTLWEFPAKVWGHPMMQKAISVHPNSTQLHFVSQAAVWN